MSLPYYNDTSQASAANVDDLDDGMDASVMTDAAVSSFQRRPVARNLSFGSTASKAAAAALADDDEVEDIEALLPRTSSNNKLKAHAGLPHVPHRRKKLRPSTGGESGEESKRRVSKSPFGRSSRRGGDGSSNNNNNNNNSSGSNNNMMKSNSDDNHMDNVNNVDDDDDEEEVDADLHNSIGTDAAIKPKAKRRSSNSKAAAAVLAAMGSSAGDLLEADDNDIGGGDVEEARALLPAAQRTKVKRTSTGPTPRSPRNKQRKPVRRTLSSQSSKVSSGDSSDDDGATSGDDLLPHKNSHKEGGKDSSSTGASSTTSAAGMSEEQYALCEKLKKQANGKFNKGDFEAASALYTKALKVVADAGHEDNELVATLYSNRAMAFYRKKDFQKCVEDCDRAIDYDPTFEKSYTRKWRALVAQGDDYEAVCECLEKAHKAIPSSQKIKEELEKARSQIPLNNKNKRSWDARSRQTSRTSSVRSVSEHQDVTENQEDGDDLMADISRKSNRSVRSHRSLRSIRDEKKTPEQLELEQKLEKRVIWCCGLTRCAWGIITLTALVGFAVGLILPFMLMKPESEEQIIVIIPPLPETIDPSIFNNTGGTVMYDENGRPTYIPNTSEGDTSSPSENDDTPSPAEIEKEPVVVEIPIVDVWKLFGNETLVLPSVGSAEELARTSFEEDHLVRAAQLFVEGMVHKNVRKPALRTTKRSSASDGTKEEYVIPFMDTPLSAYDGEVPYPTAPRSSGNSEDKYPQGDVGKWEERLKHLGIHESDDTVQLDATNGVLYVARDNRVEAIDTQAGTIRATINLPQPSPQDEAQELLLRDTWLLPLETDESPEWKPAPPIPFIEQLLVTSTLDHLVVVVSNYTSIHQARVKPILKDSFVTYLFTYHLTHRDNITEWELVNEEPHAVHGRVLYAAQASSNQHIHIVTSCAIDTARLLEDPLERLYYPEFNDNFYADEVLLTAEEKYIPLYVQRLLDEFQAMEEGAHNLKMMPLIPWVSGIAASDNEQQLEHTVMAQNHLQELIVVTSLSIVETNSAAATTRQAATPLTTTSTAVVQTAFLGPSGVGVIGSTDVHLTLTVPGYQWTDDRVLQEATHILQWELGMISQAGTTNLAATRFQGLGTVPGRLLQSARQSAELRGRDLRMATVVGTEWHMGLTDETEPVIQETSVQRSYIHVLDADTLAPRLGSPLALFEEQSTLLASVSFLEDIAYAFPLEPVSSSVRANKTSIQVVEFESAAEEKAETAPALRIAASIGSNPTGFSPHIHALSGVDSEQRLLVTIGENKAPSGSSMGWMVSLWDATDISMLLPLIHHPLEPPNTITDWVPQTFRVNPNGQLILPMTVEHVGEAKSQVAPNQRDMSGFVVLDLSPSAIEEQTVHVANKVTDSSCARGDTGCPLEARSFWLDPGLLTVAGRSIKLTSISTTDNEQPDVVQWSLSLNN